MLRVEGKVGELLEISERSARTSPCCGYVGLEHPPYSDIGEAPYTVDIEPPYSIHFGEPSYELCPCCGFEFGNDDEPGTSFGVSFAEFRREWIASGARWFEPDKKPSDWDYRQQLKSANIV